jgi:hypothetical protein
MPFTETASGADRSEYGAVIRHAATDRWVSVAILSDNANGTVPEDLAEQIFADIAQILSGDARFDSPSVTRTRPAQDVWTPPTV